MALRSQVQPRQPDRLSQASASDTKELRRQLRDVAILDGRLVTADLTTGTDNTIQHGMKRQLRGWLLADLDTDTNVWRTGWSATELVLQCGADCSVAVWVF